MIPAVKSRRGMTLAELMVAMGMVAIMIVMIVSFTMLMTGHTQGNGERLAFQQDFAVVKAQVEGWMNANAGETLTAQNDTVKAGENDLLKFQYNVLTAGDNTYRTENITAVTFDLVDKDGEYLLFCTVTGPEEEMSYTFCVNPRVGETVGGT